jgi:hypothetical protein
MMTQSIYCSQADQTQRLATFSKTVKHILRYGRITTADRNLMLRMATSEKPLTAELDDQIKQVFDRLRMGLIKVVD